MKPNEARKFEVSPGNEAAPNHAEEMHSVLSAELKEVKKRKVTSIEEGTKKNREMARVRKTLDKLTEPAKSTEEIKREQFNLLPKQIAELKQKRKELSDRNVAETNKPWWKKLGGLFDKKDNGSELELMRVRKAIEEAEMRQSNLAHELGQKPTGPRLVPELTLEPTPDTTTVYEQNEDDSETIETEAVK